MALPSPSPIETEFPSLEDHLVEDETRYEMWEGELVYVPPADPPHASRHSKVSALLEAHARPEYQVASDLLTRVSRNTEIAPDASVYPRAPDPRTGGRQLEQLAFEVVSTQSLGHVGKRAAKLAARGVRRVFAIHIVRDRVFEWSARDARWIELERRSAIADATLAAPLPVDALIDVTKADDAIAGALLARSNPVLEADRAKADARGHQRGRMEGWAEGRAEGRAEGQAEGRAEGRQAGERQGLAEGLLRMLDALGVSLDAADRARILGETDPQRLERWYARAARCATSAELFAEH